MCQKCSGQFESILTPFFGKSKKECIGKSLDTRNHHLSQNPKYNFPFFILGGIGD
jgi:hypothetical protein